jgi:quercetin dioxygenase-like cupin family protein
VKLLLKKANWTSLVLEAKRLAEEKLARNENADEFLEVAKADGFKICLAAGKTIKPLQEDMHDNPRDVFMLVLEGEVEFAFENGEREIVRSGECFVLSKNMKHRCVFRRLTTAVEGMFEKRSLDGRRKNGDLEKRNLLNRSQVF